MFNRDIINHLKKWKNKANRKPLIVRGARQVGKTSAVKIFADEFDHFININLEKAEFFELFKKVESIHDFEEVVNITMNQKIIAGKTLIFIDEIQNTPNLIKLLRFFYEDRPKWYVIASGSLLDVHIEKHGFSMPVGRVEYAYMHSLTFFEFLNAISENNILDFLKKVDFIDSISEAIHTKSMGLFLKYTLIGGMPEIVAMYAAGASQADINSVYSALLTAYSEDIYKYTSKADIKYVHHILEQAPFFAGERITYENFGGSLYKSREMSEAFGIIEKAMLLTQVRATKSTVLPLIKQEKRAKKLIYLDAGLVNYKNNIQSRFLNLIDLNDLYRGKIAEQIIGQNLIANNLTQEQDLFYWAREKPNGSAEVDFCKVDNAKIIGIEVKSGHTSRLKSLLSFASVVENSTLIRVYNGELKNELVKYGGKEYKLLSIPFYLVNRI